MHNTIGDVALTNIGRKTNYSMILCSVQYKSSWPFLSLGYILSISFNLGHFSASCSYEKKMFLIKMEYNQKIYKTSHIT